MPQILPEWPDDLQHKASFFKVRQRSAELQCSSQGVKDHYKRQEVYGDGVPSRTNLHHICLTGSWLECVECFWPSSFNSVLDFALKQGR